MEKIFRQFNNQEEADHASFLDDNELTCEQRFQAFMQLMAPYYNASNGFQRVYRTDDFKQRAVRDDWGLRIQPLPNPTDNTTNPIAPLVVDEATNPKTAQTATGILPPRTPLFQPLGR